MSQCLLQPIPFGRLTDCTSAESTSSGDGHAQQCARTVDDTAGLRLVPCVRNRHEPRSMREAQPYL